MTPKRIKKQDLIPLALLFLCWTLFNYKTLFLGQTFVLEDSSRFFYPFWKWGAEVWSRGLIPLWNPDAGFGTPYLADPQMAAWYPPSRLFYFIFSPTNAFTFLILLHYLWVLLGCWVFGRTRGFCPWVVLGSCLILGFSFNAVTLSWATPMLFAYSWVPWIFHEVDYLRESRKGSFLLLSLFLALQMAAGYPLFSYLTLLALSLEWFLIHLESAWKRNWLKEAGLEMGAVFLAVGYNAAWLLPFKEFIPYSNLDTRLGLSEFLDWTDLATWMNPFFKGHPLHSHPEVPFSVTVYFVGLPGLVVLGWASLSRKVAKVSLSFFLILLILSLGPTAYLGGLLKTLFPGYGLIVRSGYWIPFVIWALARIFMEVEGHLIKMTEKTEVWVFMTLLIYFLAVIMGVPWELWSLWLSFFFLLGVGFQKIFTWEWRRTFLILSLLFSMGPVAQSVNFTMEKPYYNEPPLAFSQLSAPGRIYNAPSVEDYFRNVSGNGVADAYKKLKEAIVSNWPLAFGFQEVGYSNALFMKPFLNWYYAPFWDGGSLKILDYLNSRYVVGWMPGFNGVSFMSAGTVPLWENPSAEPKWRSCDKAIAENDWKTDFGKIKKNEFEFSKTCFVSNPTIEGFYKPRVVLETQEGPNTKSLRAVGKGRALLISSEIDYPGWKMKANGIKGKVEEVNHGFQGVVLDQGQGIATLSYQPTTFRLGAFLSFLVCAVWVGMALKIKAHSHA